MTLFNKFPYLVSLLLVSTVPACNSDRLQHDPATDPVADSVSDPVTGLEFIRLPAGDFVMGTKDLQPAVQEMPEPNISVIKDETPAHTVRISHDLLMARTEVTQALWLDVMGTRPGPDSHWQHAEWRRLPVVSVSWNRAQAFIDELNQRAGAWRYRLPTEAEWEYAARAGSSGLRPFPVLAMDEYAWYINSSNDEVQPVAGLKANAFGLYDIYGNAWEWVSDWYQPDSYQHHAAVDPAGPDQGTKKVRRGGSYHCPPHLIRPGYRAADEPDVAYSVHGFRLVAEPR